MLKFKNKHYKQPKLIIYFQYYVDMLFKVQFGINSSTK